MKNASASVHTNSSFWNTFWHIEKWQIFKRLFPSGLCAITATRHLRPAALQNEVIGEKKWGKDISNSTVKNATLQFQIDTPRYLFVLKKHIPPFFCAFFSFSFRERMRYPSKPRSSFGLLLRLKNVPHFFEPNICEWHADIYLDKTKRPRVVNSISRFQDWGIGVGLIFSDFNFLMGRKKEKKQNGLFPPEYGHFIPWFPCLFLGNFEKVSGEIFQEIKVGESDNFQTF